MQAPRDVLPGRRLIHSATLVALDVFMAQKCVLNLGRVASEAPSCGGTFRPRRRPCSRQRHLRNLFHPTRLDDEHLFPSLALARRIIEAWRTDYNSVRPHSSLGGLPAAEFTNRPRHGQMDTEAKFQRPKMGSRSASKDFAKLLAHFNMKASMTPLS